MDKAHRKRILQQVKMDRAARRQIQIDLQIPQVQGRIHQTSKKDRVRHNTVQDWEDV